MTLQATYKTRDQYTGYKTRVINGVVQFDEAHDLKLENGQRYQKEGYRNGKVQRKELHEPVKVVPHRVDLADPEHNLRYA